MSAAAKPALGSSEPALGSGSVSVIVMAFNEVSSLRSVVDEIEAALMASDRPFEVLIIDDGSSDGTADLSDRLASERSAVRAIHHPVNRGIGEVYRSGFAAARGDYVTFLPADGQFPASVVTDFAERMSSVDIVLGYIPAQGRNRTPTAKLLSAAEKALFRLMFGRLPRFQGIMMFRRTLLQSLRLETSGRGWGILLELIVKASRANLPIVSARTPLRGRMAGTSKVNNLKTVLANLQQALSIWRRTTLSSRHGVR